MRCTMYLSALTVNMLLPAQLILRFYYGISCRARLSKSSLAIPTMCGVLCLVQMVKHSSRVHAIRRLVFGMWRPGDCCSFSRDTVARFVAQRIHRMAVRCYQPRSTERYVYGISRQAVKSIDFPITRTLSTA